MSDIQLCKGDAFELLSRLPDDYADCAVVDYPWEFSIQNGTGRMEYRRKPGQGDGVGDRELDREDAMFEMASDESFPDLLDSLSRVLTPGSWLICMADDRFQDPVRNHLRESEFTFRRNWAWTPKNMGMGYYGRVDHYPIPVATLGETDRYVQGRGTLYEVPNGRDTEYPTGKPVDLYRQLLDAPVLKEGDRLLEPFCGSAPGLPVAKSKGCDYWGCDISEDAVSRSQKREAQSTVADF